jgi:hypothetical protein
MCEPWVIAKTGLTVAEHQARTVENYLTLRDLAPDLPFIPVLQGWELADYHAHADAYAAAGVDLTQPVVGIGSVCRRQATGQIAGIFDSLHGPRASDARLRRQDRKGSPVYADALTSADSLAWSYGARQDAEQGHPALRQEDLRQLPALRPRLAGSGPDCWWIEDPGTPGLDGAA